MPRRWPRGLDRKYLPLALSVALVCGVGWVFGTRALAIRRTQADLRVLRLQEKRVHEEISGLRGQLAEASSPLVVEREARLRLRWGFPGEERIVILQR